MGLNTMEAPSPSVPSRRVRRARRRHGWAWIGLCGAVALHVADEAMNDFLAFYNPFAERLQDSLGLPLPTYTFQGWLSGLIIGIVMLMALSPFAFLGTRGMRVVAYVFGELMLLNGLNHLVISIVWGRPVPGVYSSPLMMAAAAYLLVSARRSALADNLA